MLYFLASPQIQPCADLVRFTNFRIISHIHKLLENSSSTKIHTDHTTSVFWTTIFVFALDAGI